MKKSENHCTLLYSVYIFKRQILSQYILYRYWWLRPVLDQLEPHCKSAQVEVEVHTYVPPCHENVNSGELHTCRHTIAFFSWLLTYIQIPSMELFCCCIQMLTLGTGFYWVHQQQALLARWFQLVHDWADHMQVLSATAILFRATGSANSILSH